MMSDNSKLNKLKDELIGPIETGSEKIIETVKKKTKKNTENKEGQKVEGETSITKKIWAQKGNINRPIHGFNRRGK